MDAIISYLLENWPIAAWMLVGMMITGVYFNLKNKITSVVTVSNEQNDKLSNLPCIDHKKHLESSKDDYRSLDSKVSKMNFEITYINKNISDLSKNNQELGLKVSNLDSKVSHLDSKVSDLDAKVSKMNLEITYINKNIGGMSKNIGAIAEKMGLGITKPHTTFSNY